MPKDNIERAIAKGTGEGADADALEAVIYEGYGPGGVAMLVEALTDNRNRTGSEMRHIFAKHGGNLGEPGSVAYLFDKKGVVVVDGERYSEDDLMVAIDAGAEDIAMDADVFEVLCEPTDLAAVRAALPTPGVEVEERRGRPAAEDARAARRGRRHQGPAPDRRARGPGRRRRGARELRRRRRDPRTRRRLSGAPACGRRGPRRRRARRADGARQRRHVDRRAARPRLRRLEAGRHAEARAWGRTCSSCSACRSGWPWSARALGRLEPRAHPRHGRRDRPVPAGLDALDARRARGRPPQRRARQGDDHLGRRRRAVCSRSGSSGSPGPRLPTG